MDFWTFIYYSATFWISLLMVGRLAFWFCCEMGLARRKGGEK